MIQLIIHLPRTTPRAEWVKANRWRRLTEHWINAELLDRTDNLATFGTTHPELETTT